MFSGFTVDSEPGARATGTPNHPALALGARKQPADRETWPRNTLNMYLEVGEAMIAADSITILWGLRCGPDGLGNRPYAIVSPMSKGRGTRC